MTRTYLRRFIKKPALVLLTVALLLPCLTFVSPVSTYAAVLATWTVNGTNTSRGDGDLIVYTASNEHTGTNEWGYEVQVNSDGVIIAVGGNDLVVPDGGMVVSGHNSADGETRLSRKFLEDNALVGRYCYYNSITNELVIADCPTVPTYTISYPYNAFDEYRQADMMIIYRSGTSTRTNEWGYEVSVNSDGEIFSVGGNNSAIPKNGYVVSGHGVAATFLRENVHVGMSVVIDTATKNIKFSFTVKSNYLNDLYYIAKLREQFEDAKKACINIDYTAAKLAIDGLESELEEAYNAHGSEDDYTYFSQFSTEFIKRADALSASMCESVPVEYRGVWIRPVQKTRAEVADYVDRLYRQGVNMLCIETLYNGYMIMPMPEDSLFEQNPAWKGFDMLQAFTEECHKRNMELHLWMPVYYVGHTGSADTVFMKKPEWRIENYLGQTEDSTTFQFLDPCNPEVSTFLLETYTYILDTYDVDGLQLDYIRFQNADWGFNQATKDGFKAKTGYTVGEYNTSASWWIPFCKYRADFVTDFVVSVRNMIDTKHPDVMLSADVFSNVDSAVTSVCQDTKKWLEDGLLDIALPMAYGDGVTESTLPMLDDYSDTSVIVCGLGAFESNVDKFVYLHQIEYCRSYGCLGSCGFEASAYLNKSIGTLAITGPFSTHAVTPSWQKDYSIEKYTDFIKERVNGAMVTLGYITKSQANTICNALETAVGSGSYASLNTYINNLASAEAKTVLKRDLINLQKISALPDTGRDEALLCGDVNGDNDISVLDFISLRLHLLGVKTASESGKQCADVNFDGTVNASDYIIIRLRLLGLYY